MSYFGIPIRNGLPIGLGSVAPLASGGGSPFSPLSLFASGAPGVWYDPSDYTTLFQDSAGTTPVTAVEQPVGLMLDKSGYGNHAFQATSASRPVLSARYNLLTKTEEIENAAWVKTPSDVATYQGTGLQAVITANFGVAPDGTSTADRVQLNCNGGTTTSDRSGFNQVFPTVIVGLSYTASFYIKPLDSTTDSQILNSNLGVLAAGPAAISSTIEDVGGGWKKVVKVFTPNVPNGTFRFQLIGSTVSTVPVTFDGLIWGASLVPANQSTLPYQRVNTATDYATTGFLPYLKFDGVDDSLSTNSISFTSTDKMSVFAGVRKLSDPISGQIAVELSDSATSNAGAFFIAPTVSATVQYGFRTGGTIRPTLVSGNLAAPITNIITGIGDISGDVATLRINGAQVATGSADQGTGNFGNYPLYIGRRNNASLPFNGQLYSMVIVGKAVTAGELSSSEAYVNQKTGAY